MEHNTRVAGLEVNDLECLFQPKSFRYSLSIYYEYSFPQLTSLSHASCMQF